MEKKQELSYRKQIARQLRHNMPRASMIIQWPWNLSQRSLKVTGNGTIKSIIHDLLLDELLDVEYYRDLETWVTQKSLKVI